MAKNGLACWARKSYTGSCDVFQEANSSLFDVMANFRNRVLSVNSTPKNSSFGKEKKDLVTFTETNRVCM